jgi:diguanylate cyclase (GGDEF)-like protein
LGIICVLAVYLIIDFSTHLRVMIKSINKNQKVKLSKEDKMKYIDQLTSLKNRAYLNSKIESWDESETYPQSIIVIDLNNISYVNDNYGREEGDKVITEAANILIQHQLANSEIIRTDGNEFLIYLVGYSEKQIISYLRKLSKEFKGLSHGFGAASGYSIILDAIKTIDDAVNEATLNMRENKEDIDY